jgi:indole-3-glycerol phosphate synthase
VVAVNNKDILLRERGPAALERSCALLPAVLGSGTRCPVSASGIDSPVQAARLLGAGFRGLLVGTGLLLAEDIGGWVAAVDRHRGLETT